MAMVGKLCAPAPTTMQRIVVLSLMWLIVNVHGIQNIASGAVGGEGGGSGNGGSSSGISSQISNELTQRSDFYTVEYEPTTTTGTSNYQPPTELIGFTLADATVNRPVTSNAISPSTFDHRYQAATLVPPQLQTTPILSYRDPYTDEHHHYTPSHQQQQQHHFDYNHHHDHYHGSGGHHQPQQSQQLQLITDDHRTQPQEYTVQSSLLVDAHQPTYDVQHNKRRITVGGGQGGNQRPGLVFEEPLGVNSLYAANYAATRPLGPYTRPTRPPAQPPPPRPPPSLSSTLSSSSSSFNGVGQRPYLSYDSHDYPPPSYYQQQHQQQQQRPPPPTQQQPQSSTLQQLYAQSPQRQDTTAPNYANNFGNYLPNAQYQQLQQQQQQQYQQQQQQQPETYYRPLPGSNTPPARPPAYNNYYNYHLGELPPKGTRPSYRPPPPPPTQPAQSPLAGLANLATLFSDTTQQYAPQFTNLLLGTLGVGGGGGGGGGAGGGAIASIASNLVGGGNRPLNTQLIRALENIARNDDLQCVPKVLCQMIARQTERGQLPTFVTSPAITNFLAGFPTASPALIYGRAALLGISGGESGCTRSYAKCPKNEYEILYYLNNHRGGFFKFFSEPAEKEQTPQQQHTSDDVVGGSGSGGGASILSFLSALTGGGGVDSIGGIGTISVPPTSTPRPRPTTEAPDAFDNITSGIGGFFTQVLSDYLGGGVEYQRRRRRRRDLFGDGLEDEDNEQFKKVDVETAPIKSPVGSELHLPEDFQDPEDEEDTQDGVAKPTFSPSPPTPSAGNGGAGSETTFQFGHIEGRILHKDDILSVLEQPKFFPDDEEQQERLLRSVIAKFNTSKASRRLKFPTAVAKTTEESQSQVAPKEEASEGGHILFEEAVHAVAPPTRKYRRRGKKLIFADTETAATQHVKTKAESSEGGHVLFEEDAHVPVTPTRKYRRRGKKLVFADTETAATQQVATVQQHQALTPQGGRVIFPDGSRSGRILNRPNEVNGTPQYDDADKFVISNAQRPEASGAGSASLYLSQSHSSDSQYSSSITNRYSSTYSSQHNGGGQGGAHKTFKMYDSLDGDSAYTNGGNKMRYSSRYQTTTTRRPPTTPREDNKNIYVTNGQGVTEYFITPDGRKVYL